MQDVDFIYGDLDNFTLDQQVEQVQEDNRGLLQTIEKLEKTAKTFQEEISELKKINHNLEINISVLYKTAKLEVDRKDKQVAELRRELDNLKFRRGNKKDTNRKTDNQPNIEFLLKENERSKVVIEQKNKIIHSLTKELENTKRELLNQDNSLKRNASMIEDDKDLRDMLYKKRKLEHQLDDIKNKTRDREYKMHSKIHDIGRFRSRSKSRDMDNSSLNPRFDKKQSTFRRNRSGSRERRRTSVIDKHSKFHNIKYENLRYSRSKSRSRTPVLDEKYNNRISNKSSRVHDSKTYLQFEDNKMKMFKARSKSSSVNDKRYHKHNNDASASNALDRKHQNNLLCDSKIIYNNIPLNEGSQILYNTCNTSQLVLKYDKIEPDLIIPLDTVKTGFTELDGEINCSYDNIDSDEDKLLFQEVKLSEENLQKTLKCTKVPDLKTSSSTLKTEFQEANEKYSVKNTTDRSKNNSSIENNKIDSSDLHTNKNSIQQKVNKFVQSGSIEEKLNKKDNLKFPSNYEPTDAFKSTTNDHSKNNSSIESNKIDSFALNLQKNSTQQVVNKFENNIKAEETKPIKKDNLKDSTNQTSNFEPKVILKTISNNRSKNNSSMENNKIDSVASDLNLNKNSTQQIMNKFVKSSKVKENKSIQKDSLKYPISQTSNFVTKDASKTANNNCSKNNSSLEINKTDSVSSGLNSNKNNTKKIMNKYVNSSKVEENQAVEKLLETEENTVITNKVSPVLLRNNKPKFHSNNDDTQQTMNELDKCLKWNERKQNSEKEDFKSSLNKNSEEKNFFFELTTKSTATDDLDDDKIIKNVIAEDDKRRRRKEDMERISKLKTAISECKQNIEILEHDIHSEDDSETEDEFSKTDVSEYNIGDDMNDNMQKNKLVLKIIKKSKTDNSKHDKNQTRKQINSDITNNINDLKENENCKSDCIILDNVNYKQIPILPSKLDLNHTENFTSVHNPEDLKFSNESIAKNLSVILKTFVNSEHNNDTNPITSSYKIDLSTSKETIPLIETVEFSAKQSPSSSKYQTEIISEENNSFVNETLQQTVFSLLDINLKENKIEEHAVSDILHNFDGSIPNLETETISNIASESKTTENKRDIECRNVKEASPSENMVEDKITTFKIQKENLTIENCNNVNQDNRENVSSKPETPELMSKFPLKTRRRRAIIRIT